MLEILGGAVMRSIWVVSSAVGGFFGFGVGVGGGSLGGDFLLGGGGLGFSLLLYCCSKDCSGLRGCCINVRVVEVSSLLLLGSPLSLIILKRGWSKHVASDLLLVERDSVGEGDHAGDGEEEGCSHHFVDFLC